MGLRRKGREYALQALYLSEVSKMSGEKALGHINYSKDIEKPIMEFALRLTEGTSQHIEEIDVLIKKYAKNWDMARMASLDRNILRLGTYELLYELETPVSVVIDEAVEMAKTFSTPDSGKFVNGILDKIKSNRPSENHKDGKKQDKDAE
jgi:N utilization substance protein B